MKEPADQNSSALVALLLGSGEAERPELELGPHDLTAEQFAEQREKMAEIIEETMSLQVLNLDKAITALTERRNNRQTALDEFRDSVTSGDSFVHPRPSGMVKALPASKRNSSIRLSPDERGYRRAAIFWFINQSEDGGTTAQILDWAVDDDAFNPESQDRDELKPSVNSHLQSLKSAEEIEKTGPKKNCIWQARPSGRNKYLEETGRMAVSATSRPVRTPHPRRSITSPNSNGRQPTTDTKAGMVFALVPADGSAIMGGSIADQLVDDDKFNTNGDSRQKISISVSNILGYLRKKELLESTGSGRNMEWNRTDDYVENKTPDNVLKTSSPSPRPSAKPPPGQPKARTKYPPKGKQLIPTTDPEWTALFWQMLKTEDGEAQFTPLTEKVKASSKGHGFDTSTLADSVIHNGMNHAVQALKQAGDVMIDDDGELVTMVLAPTDDDAELNLAEEGSGGDGNADDDDFAVVNLDEGGDSKVTANSSLNDDSGTSDSGGTRVRIKTDGDWEAAVMETISISHDNLTALDISNRIFGNGTPRWTLPSEVSQESCDDKVQETIEELVSEGQIVEVDGEGTYIKA